MSDHPVPTVVETPEGPLAFQHYFVRERCRPKVLDFRYEGAEQARPSAAFLEALAAPDLGAVIICPSNPYISIDPILALPGVRAALTACKAPVIAVTPIVGGQAVKGPTAKMMAERGIAPSVAGIADHYAGLIDGLVLDEADSTLASGIAASGVAVEVTATMMTVRTEKQALARAVLAFAGRIGAGQG
jgi:LPPG:FO 2-phospho-L-lactate transferase